VACALYAAPPEEAFGIKVAAGDIEVWPDIWPALLIFERMGTQWRVGMNGATGLDYAVLFELMRREGVADADWLAMFDDLRAMESAALKEMREP
jgi:hypothetical protein